MWTPSDGDCTAAPDVSTLGGPAPYLEQFTYDTGTENRLSATVVNGSTSTQQVFAYPQAGAARPHAVSSVSSTGTVNQTDTYGYDQDGDTTIRPGETLTYDPTGKLASITSGASTQQDVYDASGGTCCCAPMPRGRLCFWGRRSCIRHLGPRMCRHFRFAGP